MFNYDAICKSICDVESWPMNPENVQTMAALIYLHKHWDHHKKDDHDDDDADHRWTPEVAKRWVNGMENADGTRGAHWLMEKTEEVRRQRGISADPLEWWVAINMVYSDYSVVAEKLGTSTVEFFACMAKAFLEDKDAQPDKLAKDYEYIVRH